MMKKTAVQALVMAGILVLQTRLPAFLGVRPDILLVFVLLAALRSNESAGLRTGALAGLLVDLYSGTVIGPHLLAKGVSGYLASRVTKFAAAHTLLLVTSVVILLTLSHEIILYGAMETFLPPGPATPLSMTLQALMAAGLFIPANYIWRHGPTDEQPI